MKRLWPLLVTVAVSAVAQEPPAIDRTDPKAVAEAYVQACRDGDLEAALSLLEPDEGMREHLRKMVGEFHEEGAPGYDLTLGDFVAELQFMPLPFSIDRAFAGAKTEGDTTTATFRANWAFDQQIVLARQPDGTWAVKFVESIKATTQRERSWIADELAIEGEPGPPDEAQAAMEPGGVDLPVPEGPSATVLMRLYQAAMEYAGEHEGRLPSAEGWTDELELYLLDRSLLKNPEAPDLQFGYAVNVEVGGVDMNALWGDQGNAAEPLLFIECDTGERNAVTSPDGVAQLKSPRPDGTVDFVTLAGRAGALKEGMTFAEARAEAPAPDEAVDNAPWEQYSACTQHLMTLVQAIRRYAREHGGLLPSADSWQDDIAMVVLDADQRFDLGEGEDPGDIYRCPAAPDLDFAYALNAEVAGRNALDLTGQDSIILLFESDLNRPNAAGSPERDMAHGRHRLPDREPISLMGYLSGRVDEFHPPDAQP